MGSAVVALLASCAVVEGPTPDRPERPTPPPPETAPVFVEGGTAEENLPVFVETIRAYAESDEPILGESLVNAVANVGFSKDDMQVTHDFSKMQLPADNLFVSVRIGEECLIGQIAPEDRGSFVAELVPAVGPEHNICLIGDTRDITW